MRVLITGISGFVGRHLTAALVAAGHDVAGTARADRLVGEFARSFPAVPVRPADITDEEALGAVLAAARPDAVVHLAAQANVGLAQREPRETFRINFEGTRALLDAARRACPDARLLLVASAHLYGRVRPEDCPLRETQPLAPQDPYGLSKACADLLGRQYAEGYGMAIIRARPFTHVGAGQGEGFVFPDFARRIVEIERGRRRDFPHGDLAARRDFTHVRDVVRAYVTLVERGTPGEVYHVASGCATAIGEVLELFRGLAQGEIRARPDETLRRAADMPLLEGDATKLRALGWAPRETLATAAEEVLAEWRLRLGAGGA